MSIVWSHIFLHLIVLQMGENCKVAKQRDRHFEDEGLRFVKFQLRRSITHTLTFTFLLILKSQAQGEKKIFKNIFQENW